MAIPNDMSAIERNTNIILDLTTQYHSEINTLRLTAISAIRRVNGWLNHHTQEVTSAHEAFYEKLKQNIEELNSGSIDTTELNRRLEEDANICKQKLNAIECPPELASSNIEELLVNAVQARAEASNGITEERLDRIQAQFITAIRTLEAHNTATLTQVIARIQAINRQI